jgi:hypothetical protein
MCKGKKNIQFSKIEEQDRKNVNMKEWSFYNIVEWSF